MGSPIAGEFRQWGFVFMTNVVTKILKERRLTCFRGLGQKDGFQFLQGKGFIKIISLKNITF